MIEKKYDVAIIGAGTAGLTARKNVANKTDNYIIIDNGPMGTTCARVGCMPSKVLIQVANDFHSRKSFDKMGILGADHLTIDHKKVMDHVRKLRDNFVKGVKSSMPSWENKLVRKKALFIDDHTLDLEGQKIYAEKIIIATGSRPIIPKPWLAFKQYLITTDDFFELETLPKKVAIIGLGVIGMELGQALNRLGVEVIAIGLGNEIGGLTDPEIQNYAIEHFKGEMQIHLDGATLNSVTENNMLEIEASKKIFQVEKAIVAVGRTPNIDNIGIENLNVELDHLKVPAYNPKNLSLKNYNHIFLAGDVTGRRPLLHEAADEGVISAYNSTVESQHFKRRIPLGVTFSDPNIATVGKTYKVLKERNIKFIEGTASFSQLGRAVIKNKGFGILKIYATADDGLLLGAEIFAPDGEHLTHLISWGISLNLYLDQMLTLPFYHPVIEEGLRAAIRDAKSKLKTKSTTLEIIKE